MPLQGEIERRRGYYDDCWEDVDGRRPYNRCTINALCALQLYVAYSLHRVNLLNRVINNTFNCIGWALPAKASHLVSSQPTNYYISPGAAPLLRLRLLVLRNKMLTMVHPGAEEQLKPDTSCLHFIIYSFYLLMTPQPAAQCHPRNVTIR